MTVDPAEWPLWTRRTGKQSAADKVGQSDFQDLLNTPSWLMPLRDRSGLSRQPFWHGVRGRNVVQDSLESAGALV